MVMGTKVQKINRMRILVASLLRRNVGLNCIIQVCVVPTIFMRVFDTAIQDQCLLYNPSKQPQKIYRLKTRQILKFTSKNTEGFRMEISENHNAL